jgi:prefoldin subunit 5
MKNEIAIAVAGIITTVLGWVAGKRRNNAEIDNIIVGSVSSVTNEFKSIIEILKKDSDESRKHRKQCEEDIAAIKRKLNQIEQKCKGGCFLE